MFVGKLTEPLSMSGPCSIRISSESPHFRAELTPQDEGSVWRRLPQAHIPPLPNTLTKLRLTLSFCSWARDSSPKNQEISADRSKLLREHDSGEHTVTGMSFFDI